MPVEFSLGGTVTFMDGLGPPEPVHNAHTVTTHHWVFSSLGFGLLLKGHKMKYKFES